MQVQKISNNNYNTNFGATLKVRNSSSKNRIERNVINFLEREFPKRTKDKKGHLDLAVGFSSKLETLTTKLKYSNGKHNRYKDKIEIYDMPKQKEELLDSLVNSLDGFIIRETAQKKIERLKKEIIDVSDKAFWDSIDIFSKQFVCERNPINEDIASKYAPFCIEIVRP